MIKGLGKCAKDPNNCVKEAAIGTLGQIGVPESLLVLDDIIDTIKEEDVEVKTKAVWALGRLASGCDSDVKFLLTIL